MEKIRISAVRYANTYPFIWGLRESGFEKKVTIEIDHPSGCAEKLISGKADIGLVPVAALPRLKSYNIAADYCIGANGNVRTVMLFTNGPFTGVKKIYLDYRSMTSVNLTRVLAGKMWKREFEWSNTSEEFGFLNIAEDEAVVLIGDQCTASESFFNTGIDLAGEWKKYTGLPFVFAVWASTRELDKSFRDEFNNALKLGVDNLGKVSDAFAGISVFSRTDLEDYLRKNIDFSLDGRKIEALELFLKMLADLGKNEGSH
ncbi:MAG TPA: menaquinone biosynthesis protein [Bacteroidales bacterium]|nr:menaquinone biosynthesis protein [Bacteroidales bacterium]